MGCTHHKEFFFFSKIRKTENQHEMGMHNLGQNHPQYTFVSLLRLAPNAHFFVIVHSGIAFFKKGMPDVQGMQGLRRVNFVCGT